VILFIRAVGTVASRPCPVRLMASSTLQLLQVVYVYDAVGGRHRPAIAVAAAVAAAAAAAATVVIGSGSVGSGVLLRD